VTTPGGVAGIAKTGIAGDGSHLGCPQAIRISSEIQCLLTTREG